MSEEICVCVRVGVGWGGNHKSPFDRFLHEEEYLIACL